jgi:hypothetical protein
VGLEMLANWGKAWPGRDHEALLEALEPMAYTGGLIHNASS